MLSTTALAETGAYDEALDRFHRTGPEYDGYLSNHGPMVVEALARLGRSAEIHPWTDGYAGRLDEPPRGVHPISDDGWREALGDTTRSGDWIAYFDHHLDEESWSDLLALWWPRLLPGIAGGATHGVIRVGHAVRALRAAESQPRTKELAAALAHWAARWQAVPLVSPTGGDTVAEALARVPRVEDQDLGIGHRLAQLGRTPGWSEALGGLARPALAADVPAGLTDLVSAVLAHYAANAHGNPTMLVHAATAPMAVRNTLPSLPQELWSGSFDAAWSAAGAVVAAYRPERPRPVPRPVAAEEVLDRALAHGGEHVIKLTDTALAVHDLTGHDHALSAALTSITLDA